MTMDDCRALLAEWLHGGHTDDLRARTERFLNATDETSEPGPRFGVSVQASASTLRALLGQVASGGVPVEDAARLIESWPTRGSAS